MGKITTLDEFERAYKARLGEPLPLTRPWQTVTEEWLSRFAEGVGDYNPLYMDRSYAADGPFHGLVASPGFLFSVAFGANASIWGHIPEADVSMDDLTILYLGASIQWHRPIWLGDRVRGVETPTGIARTTMGQLSEALICTGTTEYWNSRGELIATMDNNMLRFPNPGAGVESSRAPDASAPRIAPDPLVWQRTRRGAPPRYWDSVSDDDVIPAVPRGTYTTTELYLFAHGALSMHRSKSVAEGTVDMGAGGRADPEYARKSRAQSSTFDYGPQRICWLLQAVTDWMGDHGTLVRIETRLRRPNLVGDGNTVRGRVVRTYKEGPDGLFVEVEVENVNHADIVTASGLATVKLPARAAIPVTNPVFGPTVDGAAGIYN